MANVKLKNKQGVETTYNNVNIVNLPEASGSGTISFINATDANATATDMLADKTAYVNTTKITGTIPTKTDSDITSVDGIVTIPSGYYAQQYTKQGDPTGDALHTIRFNFMNDRKMTIEGQSSVFNITSNITQTLPPIALFAQNVGGDIQTAHRYAYKLGRTIITNGRTIVMNLFPAQRISDSAIGMYDSISNKLLTNDGTGQFYTGTELW